MGRRAKHWCATGCDSKVLSYIWKYDKEFGQSPTIKDIALTVKSCSLEEIMSDLRKAEESGWIALHLEDEHEIEVLHLMPENMNKQNREADTNPLPMQKWTYHTRNLFE